MLAVLPVGRVGSLFSCVSSLFLLLCFAYCSLSTAFLFSPPGLSRSPSPFLPLSSPLPFTLSLSLTRVVRLFYYFYKCRCPATRCYYYHSSCRGGRFLCWSTMPHCCSQKDANFNLILSNTIYVCTRLEKPRMLFKNCIVDVAFFHSVIPWKL